MTSKDSETTGTVVSSDGKAVLTFPGSARLRVECRNDGETSQPWSGKTCFRYAVDVSTAGADFSQFAYGSQHDYENGDSDHCEEMAWMVLGDLLDASNDPDEFWSLCMAEPDLTSPEQTRGVLAVLDFAASIADTLDGIAEEVYAARERF